VGFSSTLKQEEEDKAAKEMELEQKKAAETKERGERRLLR